MYKIGCFFYMFHVLILLLCSSEILSLWNVSVLKHTMRITCHIEMYKLNLSTQKFSSSLKAFLKEHSVIFNFLVLKI